MLKKLFKYFIKKHSAKERTISLDNMQWAQKIFFAVFSRYGDGIISFKVIKEFASIYEDKGYLLFTTTQLVPYAKEILGEKVEVVGVNKRNPFSLTGALIRLKNFGADIGFNPWSHGDDAEFFISFAKKYSVFKRFKKWEKSDNLYARIREYLRLEPKALRKPMSSGHKTVKKIVFVPFSTDRLKTLGQKAAADIIEKLKKLNPECKIFVCGTKKELSSFKNVEKFFFSKSSSSDFLSLLKSCDMFVGVDAGPLHIAMALNIPSIGFFGPTAPETIVDFDSPVFVLREPRLSGFFCNYDKCDNNICMDNMAKLDYVCDLSSNLTLLTEPCTLKN